MLLIQRRRFFRLRGFGGFVGFRSARQEFFFLALWIHRNGGVHDILVMHHHPHQDHQEHECAHTPDAEPKTDISVTGNRLSAIPAARNLKLHRSQAARANLALALCRWLPGNLIHEPFSNNIASAAKDAEPLVQTVIIK